MELMEPSDSDLNHEALKPQTPNPTPYKPRATPKPAALHRHTPSALPYSVQVEVDLNFFTHAALQLRGFRI